MSGQWEVVGKKKEKTSAKVSPKSGKDPKRRVENVNVKIEDVLAKSQVKNLYSNDRSNENVGGPKKPQEAAKKVAKKPDKLQEAPKPKPPKSIESALNLINVEEFSDIFEKSRLQFPDAPIVWLKELAQFLNQKIAVETPDPVFTSKPLGYPLSVVPSGIKSVIEQATKAASKSNVQLFFDISLNAMTSDMSKNLPAVGTKIFLQDIATAEPDLVASSLAKHVILKNSYQNRPNVGLSILWAVGQSGLKDFHVGIKVFEELMLPLLEMKNYSRFITKYLLDLVKSAEDIAITKEQYLLILDTVYSNKKNFPADLKADFVKVLPNLKPLLFSGTRSEQLGDIADFLVKNLANNNSKTYRRTLCEDIVECFHRDHGSLETWGKHYGTTLSSSAILLKYLDDNWDAILKKVKLSDVNAALIVIYVTNNELMAKKKREDAVVQVDGILKSLGDKMASKRETAPSYALRFILLTTFIMFVTFVTIDIRQLGWQSSRTRAPFKDAGFGDQIDQVADRLVFAYRWTDSSIEQKLPGYKEFVYMLVEPYVVLAGEFGLFVGNMAESCKEYAVEKYPSVMQSIETYAPGLVEQSKNAVDNAWSTSVIYFNKSVNYLQTEVFVGQLSPENVRRVVIEAFNTTQVKATEYYHWLYEKVQTTIK